MELKDTIEMMRSSDYKERFKAEYFQLKIRCEKLNDFLNKLDTGKLNFKPACSRTALAKQLSYMRGYLNTLQLRAKVEDINLEEK